jgi:hypothetical protein
MCKCGCKVKLVGIKPSSHKNKRFQATFNDKTTVHFGSKGKTTFLDGATEIEKENYLKRHKINEDWQDYKSPGSLSRYILWNTKFLKMPYQITNQDLNYEKFQISQVLEIKAARTKPILVINKIENTTASNLPRLITLTTVYSSVSGFVVPKSETPSVCTAAGTSVRITSGGTCTISYQTEESIDYLASDKYIISFEVTRDPQTISFAPVSTADIATKNLTLTASASSGAVITYLSSTTENCSISGSTLNLLKPGNCVVTASQAGTSILAPVSASATILLTGAVVTPKPVVTKKTIVCVKGKTTKKVSGTNPKCPKGYKLKK